MKDFRYFRNFEIAKLYHISQSGVVKWIAAARAGKLDLRLHEQDGKFYIANSTKNLATIEALSKQRKKYVNTRGRKTVGPKASFYKTYSMGEIANIISSLDIHRELPLEYTYFKEGAKRWDTYAKQLSEEKTPNMLTRNIELLESNLDAIERLLAGHKRVNVIDIGIGNCLPVKGFLEHLIGQGLLNRYIGIDISKDMMSIAEHNLRLWFGESLKAEFHVRDICRRGFDDLLVNDYFADGEDNPINIVLFLGGTSANFRNPDDAFRMINNSMTSGDLFIHFLKLDTPNSRRFFVPYDKHGLEFMSLDFSNLDPSWYEAEGFFDERQKARIIRLRLTVALSIKFELETGQRQIDINKDETILIWRYWHQNALDVITQLDRNGFDLLQASKTKDDEYLLTISKAKRYQQ